MIIIYLIVLAGFSFPQTTSAFTGIETGQTPFGVMTNEATQQCAPWFAQDERGFTYPVPSEWKAYPAYQTYEVRTPLVTCQLKDVISVDDADTWQACATAAGLQYLPYTDFNFPDVFDFDELQSVNNNTLSTPRAALTCKPEAWHGATNSALFINATSKKATLGACDYVFFNNNKLNSLNVSTDTALYLLHENIYKRYQTKTPRGLCNQDRSPGDYSNYSAQNCCSQMGYTFTDNILKPSSSSQGYVLGKNALENVAGFFLKFWPIIIIVFFIAHLIFTRRALLNLPYMDVRAWKRFRVIYIILAIILSVAFGVGISFALFLLLLTLYPPSY